METEDDMEVGLVQQFSCLGTTDKEVLIAQLQKLVGPQLNNSAAQFFLDMNNWNLQLAVGAYFDLTEDVHPNIRLHSPISAPSGLSEIVINGTTNSYAMSLETELSADEGTVPPYTKFVKMWKIRNSGDSVWPPGSHLVFKHGEKMSAQDKIYLNPSVQPGESRELSVELLSPVVAGSYEMRWQMSTPEGYLFGDEIWVIVTVAPDVTADLTQQLQGLHCDQHNQFHQKQS